MCGAVPIPTKSEALRGDLLRSSSSLSLDLQLPYHGAPVATPLLTELGARAFQAGGEAFASRGEAFAGVAREAAEPAKELLTGIALLYGPAAYMKAHYDSPTQPGRRREWLVMMNAGNAVRFRLGDSAEVLRSGDALVMDAMATLHGVEAILPSGALHDHEAVDPAERLGLPSGCRLGVLLWTAAPDPRGAHTRSIEQQRDGSDADDSEEGEILNGFFLEDDEEGAEAPTSPESPQPPPRPMIQSLFAGCAAEASRRAQQQGRYREFDYESTAGEKPERNIADAPRGVGGEEPALSVAELVLRPVSTQTVAERRIALKHIQDPSSLHLYEKTKGRCDLWSRIWSTSRVLAELIICPGVANHFASATSIEIGAGTALCGLCAALQGSAVLVTDSSTLALELVRENAELNGLAEGLLRTERLDWHHLSSATCESHEVLLGSDVLFLGANVPAVVETIAQRVAAGGCAILLDPGRPCAESFSQRATEDPRFSDVAILEAAELRLSEGALLKRAVMYIIIVGGAPTPRSVSLKAALTAAWDELLESRVVTDRRELAEMVYQYTAPP
jgi:predicted nicotinamide N-methyase